MRSLLASASTGARWLFALGLALHLLFAVSWMNHMLDPWFVEARNAPGQAADFFGIYQAGQALLRGESLYGVDPAVRDGASAALGVGVDSAESTAGAPLHTVPYFYFYRYLPPTAYVSALASLVLPPWPAYAGWVVLNEILLFWLLRSLASLRASSVETRTLLIALTLGFTPFYLEQWMGQFSFLMAALLWVTFLPHLRDEDAGVGKERWFAIARGADIWSWASAVALKSFPALLGLVYLRLGQWRRCLFGALLVLASALPWYLSRPSDLAAFLHLNLTPLPPVLYPGTYGMVSLVRGLTAVFLGARAGSEISAFGLALYPGSLAVYAWSALVFGTSLLATARLSRSTLLEGLSIWILTFFLVFKDVWEYHHVMLLPVLFVLALRGPARGPLLLGLLIALPTPYRWYAESHGSRPVSEWPAWLVLVHYGVKTIPVLALYLLTVGRVLRLTRHRRTSSRP